jgi:putative peptidoglycan lipid II flippase
MVRSFLSVIGREVRGMHEAAYLLAAFALGSQFLALIRDHLLAARFGASHTLDLYYAAFRVPDFLFATVASLLSLYALLPVLSRLEQKSEGHMIAFLRQALWLFFVGMGVISLGVFICMPQILSLVAPGLVGENFVMLARILLLQPIFLGASNILASLTQMRQRFFLYSISPLLYNIGIIFGIVVLYPSVGVAGLGWGVVFGALLHMLIQLPFFASESAERPMPLPELIREFMAVLALSVPRTLALAATQITSLVLVAMASFLAQGSITVFMFAYNLQAVPLTIIGVSYSVAAFPTLARLHAKGEASEFARYIDTALRHIFFWSIPATVFIIVLRAQLVRVILGAGAFDWGATRLTAAALALFIISLAAQSVTLLIARAYYAAGNTKKPLYWGIVDVVISVASSVVLLSIFQQSPFLRSFVESMLRVADVPGTTVLMLSLGYALGSIAEFAVGYVFFLRDFKLSHFKMGRLVYQSFAASVIGGACTYAVLTLTGVAGEVNTTIGLLLQGAIAGLLGLTVGAFILTALGNVELTEAAVALRQRITRSSATALEATEVSS